jgi:hypothetical protein
MVKSSKYHYFYKITNLLNEHFYYGIHSTDNLDDGYMGSGKRLHYAYKKYGMQNFKKEILKFFDTCSDAYEYEAEMVTEELVKNPDCYNVQLGGKGWNTKGLVSVKDKNGNCFLVFKDDPRYLSGELVPNCKGLLVVKDKNGNYFSVSVDDPRYLSGELVAHNKGLVSVKDKNGNYFSVSVDDPRYLSGELKHIWVDRKHSKETIQKVKNTFKKICHQQGSKNSQYGTCWIHDSEKSFRIKKEDLESYLQRGYIKGRKMFKNI